MTNIWIWEQTIICPSCKHDFGNSSDAMFDPEEMILECEHCKKKFIVYQNVEYHTEIPE